MGIFANLSANQKINRKIMELEAQMEALPKLERRLRDLDMDFTTLFGKVRTMMNRVEKRAAIIENEQGPAEEEEVGADPSPLEGLGLTKAQLEWQRKIERERRRMA